jgi:hypothetical protein
MHSRNFFLRTNLNQSKELQREKNYVEPKTTDTYMGVRMKRNFSAYRKVSIMKRRFLKHGTSKRIPVLFLKNS